MIEELDFVCNMFEVKFTKVQTQHLHLTFSLRSPVLPNPTYGWSITLFGNNS